MKHSCLIIGGSNGLGAAFAELLKTKYDEIIIADKVEPNVECDEFVQIDLLHDVDRIKQYINHANDVIITAGIGRINTFNDFEDFEIDKTVTVNFTSIAKILSYCYSQMFLRDLNVMVLSSFAGKVVSPLFALYGATKSALSSLCESINIELEKLCVHNRITVVEPIAFNGSSFTCGVTDINSLKDIAQYCINEFFNKRTQLYTNDIQYNLIRQYTDNPREFGLNSFDYKQKRIQASKYKIGYLSGTFDLFHKGHLNIIKQAKSQVDYLIVGVHKDTSHANKVAVVDFEERKQIVEACKYVDKVITAYTEDIDVLNRYAVTHLFVGSDYKNSDKFNKYEVFAESQDNFSIVYIDYTEDVSSTIRRTQIG